MFLATVPLPSPGLPYLCDYEAGSGLQDVSVQAVARSVPDTIQQRVHFDPAVYSEQGWPPQTVVQFHARHASDKHGRTVLTLVTS